MSTRSSPRLRAVRSGGEGEDRLFVAAGTPLAWGKDAVRRDPFARLRKCLASIGLEHDALARPPAPGIHHIAEARREFLAVIMRVALRPQVDVALGEAERPEVFLHVLRLGVAGDRKSTRL